jgi:hypothetical protein
MVTKLCGLGLAVAAAFAGTSVVKQTPQSNIVGDYIEIRSCDVYTGSCFANSEMTLTGHEAIMAWSVRNGALDGVELDGLNVIAVVQGNETLGDVHRYPQQTRSVLIVDEAASPAQRDALVRLAQQKAGALLGKRSASRNRRSRSSCRQRVPTVAARMCVRAAWSRFRRVAWVEMTMFAATKSCSTRRSRK